MKPGTTWSTTKDFLRSGKHRTPPRAAAGRRSARDLEDASAERAARDLARPLDGADRDRRQARAHRPGLERARLAVAVRRPEALPAARRSPLDALPALDAVVISHDHYDHLDMDDGPRARAARRALLRPARRRRAPRGLGRARRRGSSSSSGGRSRELPGTGLTIASTPARHFSGRGMFDRNSTLWTSWVDPEPDSTACSSAATPGSPRSSPRSASGSARSTWRCSRSARSTRTGDEIHLGPEQAVEAHRLLGGGPLLPIHWAHVRPRAAPVGRAR